MAVITKYILIAVVLISFAEARHRSRRSRQTCTGPNEVFSKCGAHGCLSTCAQPDLITRCDPLPGCYPGCICKPGYLRNDKNICVLEKDCKQCKGKNEVYSECGNNSCQKTCATLNMNVACKPICTPGCICKEGYARNSKGICVPYKNCDPQVCTGKNEIFTNCVCPCCENCATLGQNVTCNFLVCNPGCDCRPGTYRNSNGECVLPQECDCGPTQELDLCYNPCPPRTCDAIGKAFKCAAVDPNNCRPACKCKFNYRRDSSGTCIPIEQCPPLECTGLNEEYNPSPPPCLDERCESLYDPLVCPAVVQEIQPACTCKSGFLRNSNGVCIPAQQCTCPDPNQEVVSCPNPCPGGTCEAPEFAPCKVRCLQWGCQCKKGYVKGPNGKCILLSACPNVGNTTQNTYYPRFITIRVRKCKRGVCRIEYIRLPRWLSIV